MDDFTSSNLKRTLAQRFQVGRASEELSAALQVDSTSAGFLLPRMTTAEREAIASPAEGLQVFDTDVKRLFLYGGASWRREEAESIETDLTLYVDGNTGDDGNDGLSWGTAKQTFGFFLKGEADAIPHEINAVLKVYYRGDIRARDTQGALVLLDFYGSGSIELIGELTAEETFTATSYNNDRSVQGARYWITDPTKAWTPNQWRRHFVSLTGLTAKFPVRANDGTTLNLGLGYTVSGTPAGTIYSAPQILRELVTDPGVKFAFGYYDFINIQRCSISLSISNGWIDEDLDYRQPYFAYSSRVVFACLSMGQFLAEYVKRIDIDGCYFNLDNYSYANLYATSVQLGNVVVDSTDATGYGFYMTEYGQLMIMESWIGNQLTGMWIGTAATLFLNRDCYFQDCTDGIVLAGGGIACDTPTPGLPTLRCDTLTRAIVGAGNIYLIDGFGFIGWDCTAEVVFSDTDAGSLADLTAGTLSSRSQLAITLMDADYRPVLLDEYNNTTSGLTATRYQTAIDELASRSINVDLNMYVDGTSGNDVNDGLAWGTAKKTLSFLYSEDAAAIPRELNANVVIHTKGLMLAATADRHTYVDNFYGSGSLSIVGEIEDVVTGLTPTGWDDTVSSVAYHSYLTVAGTSWTANAYTGDYIQFTTPAEANLYPIMSNSTDTLETIGLTDLVGTEVFKIVRLLTVFRGSTLADPVTVIAFPEVGIIKSTDCSIPLSLQRVNVAKDNYLATGCRQVFWGQDAVTSITDDAYGYIGLSSSCEVKESTIRHLYLSGPAPIIDGCCITAVTVGNDVFVSPTSGVTTITFNRCIISAVQSELNDGLYSFFESVMYYLTDVRIANCDSGISIRDGNIRSLYNVLFENCYYGIRALNSNLEFYFGAARFKNNTTAIDLVSGGRVRHCPEWFEIYHVGNTNEVVLWNLPASGGITFAEMATRTPMANAMTGAAIVYYDAVWGEYVESRSEYNNTTSGLTATRYQTALDETYSAVLGRNPFNGIVDPSYVPSLNPLPTHITTTTFTLGATANPVTYYYRGTRIVVNTDVSATLDDGAGGSTSGLYYVYFDGASGTILATKIFQGVSVTSNPIISYIYWNGTDYGLVYEERHGYARNHSWHAWAHQWVGSRYGGGLDFVPTGTGATATFTMSAGLVVDEDIEYPTPASSDWPTAHALRTWYQTGATTEVFDVIPSTVPFRAGVNGRPTYVNETGYVLTEASSAPNRYLNFFIYGAQDLHTPVYCFVETVSAAVAADNGYTSVSTARSVPFPNLSTYNLSPEMRPLYRLVVRADGVVQTLASEDDYRLVTTLPQDAGTTGTSASAVSFSPAGNISSTVVQLAIEELDAEKAPEGATFWTATAEAGLSAEVNLGALTSGLLKHTVAAGISTPATAVAGTDYPGLAVANIFTNVQTIEHASGLVLGKDDATNTAGLLKLWSAGANAFYTTFTAGTQSANATYTLPTAMPASNGYALTSTTAGVMSWAAIASAVTPAGSTGYVQFNTGGAFDADAGFFWDNTSKRLGIGTITPSSPFTISTNTWAGQHIKSFSNTTAEHAHIVFYKSKGTEASPVAVGANDVLFGIYGNGYYNASSTINTAIISAIAEETFTASTGATRMSFFTTATGSATAIERLRITSTGYVYIGETSAPVISGAATTRKFIVSGESTSNGIVVESAADASRVELCRASGTLASKTAVVSGDQLGSINFYGWDGGTTPTYIVAAQIRSECEGTIAEDNVPGRIAFYTRNTAGAMAERMRLHGGGYLTVGTITAGTVINGTTYLSPFKVSATVSGSELGPLFLEAAGGPALVRQLVSNGTLASRTSVINGTALGGVGAYGYDGVDYVNSASVQFFVDGTPGTDDMPGRIVFYTTADGAAAWAERMRITSAGLVGIANTSPSALLTLGTAGTTAGSLSLAGVTSGTCTVQVAAAAGTWSLTLPTTGGTNGYLLQTNGSGVTTWAAPGANTALSNLAAVAINTTLLPASNDGAGLGSGTYAFSDLFLASGGVINWANGNATITHATGILTLAATTFALGTTNITMSGSLGVTGTRLTKGWFTDLEVTNAITGSVTGNAGTITVASDTADTTAYLAFVGDTSGAQAVKMNAALTVNASTAYLGATGMFIIGNGSGSTAQVVNVMYGTGDPPSTSGIPYGTIYVKHEA